MTLRTLGQSDLKITPMGIGAWAIGGGKWEFAWGAQDDKESIAAIHAGLDRGINWIDTAAVYGLGHSETVVGRAVRERDTRPYVFTKCSLVWDEAGNISHNLQAASIRREAEASLKRLGVDAIDLYQIHWPAWKGQPESDSPGSIEEAVGRVGKAQGRRKDPPHRGLEFRCAANAARSRRGPDCFSPAALFASGKGCRVIGSSFRSATQIGVIVYSPMASGMLTGAMTRERIAANSPKTIGESRARISRSRCFPAICGWSKGCAPSASATRRLRARWLSRGPC